MKKNLIIALLLVSCMAFAAETVYHFTRDTVIIRDEWHNPVLVVHEDEHQTNVIINADFKITVCVGTNRYTTHAVHDTSAGMGHSTLDLED